MFLKHLKQFLLGVKVPSNMLDKYKTFFCPHCDRDLRNPDNKSTRLTNPSQDTVRFECECGWVQTFSIITYKPVDSTIWSPQVPIAPTPLALRGPGMIGKIGVSKRLTQAPKKVTPPSTMRRDGPITGLDRAVAIRQLEHHFGRIE